MRVYLDFGSPRPSHSLYGELIDYPPEGVEYHILGEKIGESTPYKLLNFVHKHLWFRKTNSKLSGTYFRLAGKTYSELSKKEETSADLVHVCNIFSPKETSWIMDLDNIRFGGPTFQYFKKYLKRKVERAFSSKQCKKIMPWTLTGKDTLENFLNTKNYKNKIEIVYPAIHPLPKEKRHENGVNLLFIGSINDPDPWMFAEKGGLYALKCFEILSKKYDVKLFFRSLVPPEIKKKYKGLKGLVFIETSLPQNKFFDLHRKSHASLLPGHQYSLMNMLEAMAWGLPIVTMDGWANSEFVKHGKTGLVVKPSKFMPNLDGTIPAWTPGWYDFIEKVDQRVVNDLVKCISILVENNSLRRKMGRCARKRVEDGDLSIKVRNQKLKRIYEEAIRK